MKIYLDNNLGVTNVEQEELTQDTYGYNILKVYIPNAVLTPYDTFTCYYGALLQNGRKVGWFAMEARTSTDADYEENYTLYKATLEQCVVSVEGKVYIGCQVLLGNSGNATLIKKNTAVVQFNVRKSVAINNDILVLDPDQTNTDVLESYKNLLENALLTYATKATTYTKTEIDNKLNLKADKSDTYTKTEVDTINLNLAGQIAGARVELNNRINTTNNILVETNAKVASLETDIADLESVQNVVDVVATKSALQSYDTSKLETNDKIQVITDESHDSASTIYNWNGSAWQYVGAFGGNSYTKAETYNKTQIDSALSDKADKSNTYTRAVIDSMILTLSTDKADKSDTYTKTEIDNTMQEVGEIVETLGKEVEKKANAEYISKGTTLTQTSYSNTNPAKSGKVKLYKLGGMSYKSENLIVLQDVAETTINGITYKIENGVITLNGTATTNFNFGFALTNIIPVGTYSSLLTFSGSTTNSSGWKMSNSISTGNDFDLGKNNNYTKTATTTIDNSYIRTFVSAGDVFTNYVVKFMLVSGSTVPTTWSEGFTGIRDSAVTSVVSKGSNDTTIDTITIPSAIQNLTGYGQSNPDDTTQYNYIDFINKTFVRVGYIDNNTWVTSALVTDISAYLTTDTIDVEPLGTLEFLNTYNQAVPNELAYLFNAVTLNNVVDSYGNPRFIEGDGTYATITGFTATQCKWSLSGTHLMLVVAGTIANGTAIPQYTHLGDFNVPNFIFDKIQTVWGTNIEIKSIQVFNSDWSAQTMSTYLTKTTKLSILANSAFTASKDRNFRIQFDLLIDSE